MRTKLYVRVAKHGNKIKVAANSKPNYSPLMSGNRHLPTVQFALSLDIPDSEFDASRIQLEAVIRNTNPAINIQQVNMPTNIRH